MYNIKKKERKTFFACVYIINHKESFFFVDVIVATVFFHLKKTTKHTITSLMHLYFLLCFLCIRNSNNIEKKKKPIMQLCIFCFFSLLPSCKSFLKGLFSRNTNKKRRGGKQKTIRNEEKAVGNLQGL